MLNDVVIEEIESPPHLIDEPEIHKIEESKAVQEVNQSEHHFIESTIMKEALTSSDEDEPIVIETNAPEEAR